MWCLTVGWTLLALSVALVNAGSGLQALWILLSCLGFTIFALTLGRFALRWLGKITGSSMSLSFLLPPLHAAIVAMRSSSNATDMYADLFFFF